ncbi:hypothetical protein FRB95_003138, partial [Tulasnella sp. JGI-2019a]
MPSLALLLLGLRTSFSAILILGLPTRAPSAIRSQCLNLCAGFGFRREVHRRGRAAVQWNLPCHHDACTQYAGKGLFSSCQPPTYLSAECPSYPPQTTRLDNTKSTRISLSPESSFNTRQMEMPPNKDLQAL